jgi:hypothetical protein
LRLRRVLFGLAILILVSGIFIFAITTVRETHTSTSTGFFWGEIPGGGFGYGGATLPLNDSYQSIIGTSGIADLIILTTPLKDFNNWVCDQLPVPPSTHGFIWSCANFGGGIYFNITILYSYLQTHRTQIAYSQTIVDQNITLSSIAYHVDRPTDVTIVLAHFGSSPTREFYQQTVTHQAIGYPLIGYTESPRTLFTLPNISMGLIAIGAASLVILSMAQLRLHPSSISVQYKGSALGKCPRCGGENLFFAEKCRHCGRTLHETAPMMEARSP